MPIDKILKAEDLTCLTYDVLLEAFRNGYKLSENNDTFSITRIQKLGCYWIQNAKATDKSVNFDIGISGDCWSISLKTIGGTVEDSASGCSYGNHTLTAKTYGSHILELYCNWKGAVCETCPIEITQPQPTPPPPPPLPPPSGHKYKCSGSTCIQDDTYGTFTEPSCGGTCISPPPPPPPLQCGNDEINIPGIGCQKKNNVIIAGGALVGLMLLTRSK